MFSGEIAQIIALSMRVAFTAIIVSLPVAILVAYALARWRFFGRGLVNALVHLPLVLPPVVTGYLLLLAFGPRGPAGQFVEATTGLVLGFRWTGAALAAAIMAFPLLVRPMKLAFEAVDRRLAETGQTLGAGRAMVFVTISLPLALPGILAGAVLGFAKALGEFGATITFVSNIPGETRTISLAVYSLLQDPTGDRRALILIGAAVVVSLAAVAVSEWISGRIGVNGRGGRNA